MGRIVLDLDADTARAARDLIASRIIGMNAAGTLLLAIDTALEADRPQETGDVEYGVCLGGVLVTETPQRSMADAWVTAMRHYRLERSDHGDAAEPVQILVWPREDPGL